MKTAELNLEQPFSVSAKKTGYVLAIFTTVAISLISATSWQSGLALALFAAYLVLVCIRLEWGVYAVVAFAIIFIDGWTPNRSPDDVIYRLGIGHIYITELAVYGMLGVYVVERALGKRFGSNNRLFARTPLGRPLKVFALLLVVFAFYGWLRGYPAQSAFGYYEWRCLFLGIVLYFVICTIFDSRKKAFHLFEWYTVCCAFVALYSLVVYILGTPPALADFLGSGPVGEGPENYMFMFLGLSGIAVLIYCKQLTPSRHFLFLAASVLALLNIVLSEKRDPQLGFVIGLTVLSWNIPFRKKIKWAALMTSIALAAALFIGAIGLGMRGSGISQSVSRYREVVQLVDDPGSLISLRGTLSFHVLDFFDAWSTIRRRPLSGYGFGATYDYRYVALPGYLTRADSKIAGVAHNQYLNFWWKMGLSGLLSFVWIYVACLRFRRRNIPRQPSSIQTAAALGLYAAVWADAAIEVWGSSWVGNTKYPIVMFLCLALLVQLGRSSLRTPPEENEC